LSTIIVSSGGLS